MARGHGKDGKADFLEPPAQRGTVTQAASAAATRLHFLTLAFHEIVSDFAEG
jgi:hypothetical protein